MSAASVLARGQAAAEQLMVDACVIRRVTDESTGTGGVVTPTYSTLYTGRCRVQQVRAKANEVDAGEAYLLMLQLEVQLPVSVTGVQAEDQITITASAHDPDLVNRVFFVRDLAHKTHPTSRRVQVQEKTS